MTRSKETYIVHTHGILLSRRIGIGPSENGCCELEVAAAVTIQTGSPYLLVGSDVDVDDSTDQNTAIVARLLPLDSESETSTIRSDN